MTIKDEKSIAAAIKGETIQSPILIYGSEEYLKQHYLRRLLPKGDDGFSSFNDIRLDFNSLDLSILADALATPPMMSDKKSVLVYDVAPKEVNAEQLKQLDKLLSERYDDCRVVFLEKSGSFDEKRDEKSKKLIKLFDRHGTVIALKERTESECIKGIKSDAQAGGCELSQGAARLLLECCGRDMAALKNEIAKLCAYRKGGEIRECDVEALTVRKPEENIYGLSKAILRGDYDGAMSILSGLCYLRYPTESILGTLSGVYIDLYRAKMATGKSAAQVAADFGYGKRTFAIDNAMRDARRLSEEYLLYALDTLALADERLKSTQNDGRTVLEWTVTSLFLKQNKQGSVR